MVANIAARKTALIVDDEEDIRFVYRSLLEDRNYDVIEAGTGEDATDLLQDIKVDLVISDIRMPRGDGAWLTKKIRDIDPVYPPVILVTGYSDVSKEQAQSEGARALLVKPFDRDELLANVTMFDETLWKAWAAFPKSINPTFSFKKAFDKSSVTDDIAVIMGHGGMFVPEDSDIPSAGEVIDFDFTFAAGPVTHLKGMGVVSWMRPFGDREVQAGYGVEFKFLVEETRNQLKAAFNKRIPKAYIPLGRNPKPA